MHLSLRQAAKEAGVAKTTLIRALKSGRLSAQKNDLGDWAIDPAELHRVFPLRKAEHRQTPDQEDQGSAPVVLDRDASPLKATLDRSRVQEHGAARDVEVQLLREIIARL